MKDDQQVDGELSARVISGTNRRAGYLALGPVRSQGSACWTLELIEGGALQTLSAGPRGREEVFSVDSSSRNDSRCVLKAARVSVAVSEYTAHATFQWFREFDGSQFGIDRHWYHGPIEYCQIRLFE